MKRTLTALAAAVLAVSAASAYSFTYAPTTTFAADVSVETTFNSSALVKNSVRTDYFPNFSAVNRSLKRNFDNKFTYRPTVSFMTYINSDVSVTTTFNFEGSASWTWDYQNQAPYMGTYNRDAFATNSFSSATNFEYKNYAVAVSSNKYGTLEFSPEEGSVLGNDNESLFAYDDPSTYSQSAPRGFTYSSPEFSFTNGLGHTASVSYTKSEGNDSQRTFSGKLTSTFVDNAYTQNNRVVLGYEKNYFYNEYTPTEKTPRNRIRGARNNYFEAGYAFTAYGVATNFWFARSKGWTPERFGIMVPDANQQPVLGKQEYSKYALNEFGSLFSYDTQYGRLAYTWTVAKAYGNPNSATAGAYPGVDYVRNTKYRNRVKYSSPSYDLGAYTTVSFSAEATFVKSLSRYYFEDSKPHYAKTLDRSFKVAANFNFFE